MFRWIIRSHKTTVRTLDTLEFKYSTLIYWIFNKQFVKFYDKILTPFLGYCIFIIEVILYVPLYLIFILPSIAFGLFKYTSNTQILKQVKVQKNNMDKINK